MKKNKRDTLRQRPGVPEHSPDQESGPPAKHQRVAIGPGADLSDPARTRGVMLLQNGKRTPIAARNNDPLAQALHHIVTKDIFRDLLDQVARNAMPYQDMLAALDSEDAYLPPMVIASLKGALAPGVCVMVIDREYTTIDDSDIDRVAFFNPALGTIEIGRVLLGDFGFDPEVNHYWEMLHRALFELCNAAHAGVSRRITQEGNSGKLDCVSFALAVEVWEDQSCVLFNDLWAKLSADVDCCTVLHAQGQWLPCQAPDYRYPDTAIVRLTDQVTTGHTAAYFKAWTSTAKDAYVMANEDVSDAFDLWISSQGQAGAPIDHAKVVTDLIGIPVSAEVTELFVNAYRDFLGPTRVTQSRPVDSYSETSTSETSTSESDDG